MKQICQFLSLALMLSASCFGATVAEMSGTVFTSSGSGSTTGSQPVVLYLAAGMAVLYVVLRQRRRA